MAQIILKKASNPEVVLTSAILLAITLVSFVSKLNTGEWLSFVS